MDRASERQEKGAEQEGQMMRMVLRRRGRSDEECAEKITFTKISYFV